MTVDRPPPNTNQVYIPPGSVKDFQSRVDTLKGKYQSFIIDSSGKDKDNISKTARELHSEAVALFKEIDKTIAQKLDKSLETGKGRFKEQQELIKLQSLLSKIETIRNITFGVLAKIPVKNLGEALLKFNLVYPTDKTSDERSAYIIEKLAILKDFRETSLLDSKESEKVDRLIKLLDIGEDPRISEVVNNFKEIRKILEEELANIKGFVKGGEEPISRGEVSKLLEKEPDSSYLLRINKDNELVISFMRGNKINNMKISFDKGKFCAGLTDEGKIRWSGSTIDGFLKNVEQEEKGKNPLTPMYGGAPNVKEEKLLSRDEARDILLKQPSSYLIWKNEANKTVISYFSHNLIKHSIVRFDEKEKLFKAGEQHDGSYLWTSHTMKGLQEEIEKEGLKEVNLPPKYKRPPPPLPPRMPPQKV